MKAVRLVLSTIVLLSVFLWPQGAAAELHVTFLNPGHQNESFWGDVDRFMEATANNLHIDLTILHGERDSARIMRLAQQIVDAPRRPDFIVIVNEKGTGPALLQKLAPTGAGILMILNDLTPAQKAVLGQPRGKIRNWLGSLIPDNHWVGFHTTETLYQKLRQQKPHQKQYRLLAISGDRVTPASVQREQGMRDFVATHPDLKLQQVVYGHWVTDRAHDQTLLLLKRYPKTDAIWTANDMMAFGTIAAANEAGRTPGKDLLISTVNSSKKVLRMTDDGEITALGAGHFTAGGWALVMLYDYAHHHDFAHDGLVIQRPLFNMIPAHSKLLDMLLRGDWSSIDFRAHSKALNGGKPYQFSLESP
ncbi:ABC transporter substrate-binding protein [Mangrovitalea sediminis]|uniref:ABC transporter substrate-binding protein n=1 Tax=Mangrovitalea sediminis TaxID=1982043 RepID=UPI000BE55968|nr:ABC transporter substrate-binding protein [Mangrovitalea sediminis]